MTPSFTPMKSTIIESLQQDKEAGLAQLFELQRPHLRNYLNCRFNKALSSRLDASDIIQEVFIRARRNIDNYLAKPVLPPAIWLRQLAHYVVRDTHRHHFRQLRNPFQEQHDCDDVLIANLIDSTDSVNTSLQRNELADRIRVMLEGLGEGDKQVLELRHLEEYSITEISEMLEINVEAVKKRYYRALKRFREVIESHLTP